MGGFMARNLLNAGFNVKGFDLNPEAARSFAQHGGIIASTISEAIAGSDVVFTMLPHDAALSDVFLSDLSVLKSQDPDTLFVDCSTVSIDLTRRVADAVVSAGGSFLDAPVSGGPIGANNGTLTFMVGGDASALERARPMLKAMGSTIVHMGGHGTGQAAKQCNNMLAATIMTATAEAIALGVKNGLDPATLCEVMQTSTGGSNILSKWNPWPGVDPKAPSSNAYKAGFQMNLMLKDLELAMANAQKTKSSAPMAALSRNLFMMCINQDTNSGTKDFSFIQSLYQNHSC
ncbi:3-hydroxyisobutyrate dehydrogenase [Agrobacterium tumefaciens]|nr:3-hydroxyisobutyrate dehydrogenase [Agrobacterium tumefaciens]NTC44020.1 3-hydroxyisobutyrate dehydrogenase [Agrobacterium tumefaciens]